MADGDLFITHADGIQIVPGDHGAKLVIQSINQATVEDVRDATGVKIGEAIKLGIKNVAIIHLSLEHLKLFTILAHRQLAEYEAKNEPIALPKAVVETRKIDLKAEW